MAFSTVQCNSTTRSWSKRKQNNEKEIKGGDGINIRLVAQKSKRSPSGELESLCSLFQAKKILRTVSKVEHALFGRGEVCS